MFNHITAYYEWETDEHGEPDVLLNIEIDDGDITKPLTTFSMNWFGNHDAFEILEAIYNNVDFDITQENQAELLNVINDAQDEWLGEFNN